MEGGSEGVGHRKQYSQGGLLRGGAGRNRKKVFWAADQNAMYFYSNEGGVGGGGLGALGAVVRGQRK